MVDLMICKRPFLMQQSRQRAVKMIAVPAHRGMIVDRHGLVLAVSTPVVSVWANPRHFRASLMQRRQLSRCLHQSWSYLYRRLRQKHRAFVYLKRNVPPSVADCIQSIGLPHIFIEKTFHRYYPHGASSAHLVGRTDVDDRGQEGIEFAYDHWLAGSIGKEWVVKDRLGRVIRHLSWVKQAKPGHPLVLSIDQRLQDLAFRYLNEAVRKVEASSGSAIVLDAQSGEILAMTNAPSYNPNHAPTERGDRYRNRTVTDLFEPGSTIKPFALVSALLSGRYHPNTRVNTHPGEWIVQGHHITDEGLDYGVISLTEALKKSSNIGISKVTVSLPASHLVDTLNRFGFGQRTGIGFPGEAAGFIVHPRPKQAFVLATLSFGYGLSTTVLQLANAYAILANEGVKKPIRLMRTFPFIDASHAVSMLSESFGLSHDMPQAHQSETEMPQGDQVIPQSVASKVLGMLESVVQLGGTGYLARVKGYRVAGKTGTSYTVGPHGFYDKKHYIASFAGIAPLTKPRFVVVVLIRHPAVQHHYGGLVAAPTFARIMGAALKLWEVKPDAL